jgi:hypothetical protein
LPVGQVNGRIGLWPKVPEAIDGPACVAEGDELDRQCSLAWQKVPGSIGDRSAPITNDIGPRLNLAPGDYHYGISVKGQIIRMTNIMYLKWKLAMLPTQQHNASVSSNFCKELDLARFYQRAFFCLSISIS